MSEPMTIRATSDLVDEFSLAELDDAASAILEAPDSMYPDVEEVVLDYDNTIRFDATVRKASRVWSVVFGPTAKGQKLYPITIHERHHLWQDFADPWLFTPERWRDEMLTYSRNRTEIEAEPTFLQRISTAVGYQAVQRKAPHLITAYQDWATNREIILPTYMTADPPAPEPPMPITDHSASFVWPVANYQQIRDGLGATEGRRRPHSGIDIAAPTGAEIRSPIMGRAEIITTPTNEEEIGRALRIWGMRILANPETREPAHPPINRQELYLDLFHLDAYFGEYPRHVRPGELLGFVGSTGFSSGPHLHLSVAVFDEEWWLMDPAIFYRNVPRGRSALLHPIDRTDPYAESGGGGSG